jgi:hypothetical protein
MGFSPEENFMDGAPATDGSIRGQATVAAPPRPNQAPQALAARLGHSLGVLALSSLPLGAGEDELASRKPRDQPAQMSCAKQSLFGFQIPFCLSRACLGT